MSTPALGPFLRLYCKEVLGDVKLRSLRDDQLGRWVIYLCVMQENGGLLPKDAALLSVSCRLDKRKVKADLLWLPTFFETSECGGFFRSIRLEREAAGYRQKCARARKNGQHPTLEMGGAIIPEIGGQPAAEYAPDMGGGRHPLYRAGTRTHNNTPIVPASGDVALAPLPQKPKVRQRGMAARTGDKALDRYILAVATAMAAGWPKVTTGGDEMPHASRSALYARLVAIVGAGGQIDQLRARANSYLDECAPVNRGTAKIGTKAPQFFFGANGPWQDYDDVPALAPLSADRITKTLGEAAPSPLVPPPSAAATAV